MMGGVYKHVTVQRREAPESIEEIFEAINYQDIDCVFSLYALQVVFLKAYISIYILFTNAIRNSLRCI